MMIELQKGDYVLNSDIESNEMNDRIVEEMERQGFTLYGAKNKGEFFNIGINGVGEIVGGLDRGAYRQLTPAQILATPQWVPEVGDVVKVTNTQSFGLSYGEDIVGEDVEVKALFDCEDIPMAAVDFDGVCYCFRVEMLARPDCAEDKAVDEMMQASGVMVASLALRDIYRAIRDGKIAGIALTDKQPHPAEDVDFDDPTNWRAGDLFKVAKGGRSLDQFKSGTVVRKVSNDNNRYEYLDGRDWWALHDYQVRFIRRP